MDLFYGAKWMSALPWRGTTQWAEESFKRFRWADKHEEETVRNQFLTEWETSELDLDKSWQEPAFLLGGYIVGYIASEWTVPELRIQKAPDERSWWSNLFSLRKTHQEKDFLTFLVVENSEWDGLPLVNAIGAGAEIGYARGYGPVRYLLPNEVEDILDGLIKLSENGLQQRYERESQKENPCPYIDWSEEEMLEWITDSYHEIVGYYRNAAINQKAMLLYLT